MTDMEKEKQPLEQIISCAHGQSQMSPLGEWPHLHPGRHWRTPRRSSAAVLENRTLGTTAFQGRSRRLLWAEWCPLPQIHTLKP